MCGVCVCVLIVIKSLFGSVESCGSDEEYSSDTLAVLVN